MSLFRKQSMWDKVVRSAAKPSAEVGTRQLVKSGLGAGASLLVLSAVSAAASAARRRQE